MAEEKKNWLGPYIPEGNWIRELMQQARLAYNLMLDQRVPLLAKLIPVGALAYLLLPVDIAPDVLPVLGQLDDVAILMFGLRMFFEVAPPEVVREHLKRLTETVQGQWKVVEDTSSPAPKAEKGDVVDGEVKD
ncbi:MAG: YkvA family protein [Anaerolineales bacterium]